MALSCSSLCSRLALLRLCGVRASGTSNTVLPQLTACGSRFPPCRSYSASKSRHGFGRYVGAKLQKLNSKYEGFLKRRFPRFSELYHTFVEGFKLLYRDAKDVRRIKSKMISDGVHLHDLPYREMEKLRQFRRDVIKAIPLMLITIPPFANYLVFVLMYYYPRQVLIPHFWTPSQQVAFRGVYHSLRAEHHGPVLRGMKDTSSLVQNGQQQSLLQQLCAKVQSGEQPKVSEILAVRGLFSGSPLGMRRMTVDHMRRLSPLLFLTPRLPAFLIGRRLNSHGRELLLLDRALSRLGPHQLDDLELRQACFLRGINPEGLSSSQCREWLSQWLQVSTSLKESEVSLLLHSLVLLSANQPTGTSRR